MYYNQYKAALNRLDKKYHVMVSRGVFRSVITDGIESSLLNRTLSFFQVQVSMSNIHCITCFYFYLHVQPWLPLGVLFFYQILVEMKYKIHLQTNSPTHRLRQLPR